MGQAYTTKYLFPAAPGSPEDVQQLKQIQNLVDYLPIVRKLRADPKYVEWEAYEDFADESKLQRLTSGPLRGSRGLAVQVSSALLGPQSGTSLADPHFFLCVFRGFSGMKRTRNA